MKVTNCQDFQKYKNIEALAAGQNDKISLFCNVLPLVLPHYGNIRLILGSLRDCVDRRWTGCFAALMVPNTGLNRVMVVGRWIVVSLFLQMNESKSGFFAVWDEDEEEDCVDDAAKVDHRLDLYCLLGDVDSFLSFVITLQSIPITRGGRLQQEEMGDTEDHRQDGGDNDGNLQTLAVTKVAESDGTFPRGDEA